MSNVHFNTNSFHPPQSTETTRHGHTVDLENGDVEKEDHLLNSSDSEPNEKGESSDEYTQLVRYIATYREKGRRKSSAVPGDIGVEEQKKKAPWWKFGLGKKKSDVDDEFEVPDEWLETDIKKGISGGEVEGRRRKTGFNELTSEKENLFIKFLSYFQGPILYGEWNVMHFVTNQY